MFNGIIRHQGRISRIDLPRGKMEIFAPVLIRQLHPGDSIAVDGVCLTVTRCGHGRFSVDVTPETVRRTAFRWKAPGAAVNLELPMRMNDRIHGHLVLGHVDGVGVVTLSGFKNSRIIHSKTRRPTRGVHLYLYVPTRLVKFLAEKGSWAVNGVSLTISALRGRLSGSALIPETLQRTNLGRLKPGDRVNIEVDVLARYAYRYARYRRTREESWKNKFIRASKRR